MKKTLFVIFATVIATMAMSCGNCAKVEVEEDSLAIDTTEVVDTLVIDTVAVDTLVAE